MKNNLKCIFLNSSIECSKFVFLISSLFHFRPVWYWRKTQKAFTRRNAFAVKRAKFSSNEHPWCLWISKWQRFFREFIVCHECHSSVQFQRAKFKFILRGNVEPRKLLCNFSRWVCICNFRRSCHANYKRCQCHCNHATTPFVLQFS